MRNDVRGQLLDVLLDLFSSSRCCVLSASRSSKSATSALCSGDPGVLGVCASVLGRAGGVCVRFKVTCDGVLGTCALALPAVPGAAGSAKAHVPSLSLIHI